MAVTSSSCWSPCPRTMQPIAKLHKNILACRNCPLSATTFPIHGCGNPDASLMFIGMEPGDQEEVDGRPFVGPSGRYLEQAVKMNRRSLDLDFYRTNVVRCRPRDLDGKARNANWGEVAACRQWTEAEIRTVDPDVIVLTGFTALPLAFPGVEPARANGLVRAADLFGRTRLCVGLYHPAAILRQRGLAQAFARALRTALDLEASGVLHDHRSGS